MTAIQVTLCANTKARQLDKTRIKEVRAKLKAQRIMFNQCSPDKLRQLKEAELGTMLVAVGGDGTVNAVADEAIKHKRTLAVIPQGTFNHFSKDLGLPQTLEAATDVVMAGRARKIDVGQVNNKIFLNNSVIGFYPQLVTKRENLQERFGKWLALIFSACAVLSRVKTFHVELVINGETKFIRSTLMIVANNKYDFQNFGLASRSVMDEGKLYLYIIKSKTVIHMAFVSLRLLLGRVRDEDFDYYSATEFEVRPKRRVVHVALDGEPIKLTTPLKYSCLAKALTVIS
ncbi:MAG: diacylglycerol kinase family protein [Candidatus Saccharimonadales bacterium]